MNKRQHGIALIGLLALLALGACWWLVSALATPSNRTALYRDHNARVLAQAKSALLGYVAHEAMKATETNPGRFPCPEAPASANNVSGGSWFVDDDGVAAGNCALPAVGRLPWRTLGLDKLVDAAGEPLWYVLSPVWGLAPGAPPVPTVINSNTQGQLTLDGAANIVALIIAPGRAINLQTAGACIARNQTRVRQASVNWDQRDFLDCENSDGDADFTTSGPLDSYNDEVLAITAPEALARLEAAVAARFERDLAPTLRGVYAGASWLGNATLPFAAPLADPATSAFQGSAPLTRGLLPLSFSETDPGSGTACSPATDGPRCDPTFVSWTNASLSGPSIDSSNCSTTTATQINCKYYRKCFLICPAGNVSFTLTATAANLGMALRQLNNAAAMTNVDVAGRSSSGTINNDGSATITLNAQAPATGGGIGGVLGNLLCGVLAILHVCKEDSIAVPITFLADHPILSTANANFYWFFRNNWHQVSYYVVAPDIAPNGPRACGANCLTLNYRAPAAGQRGLIVISGPSLNGTARPNASLIDWLEGENCDLSGGICNPDNVFAVRTPPLVINRQFNDRIAVIDSN